LPFLRLCYELGRAGETDTKVRAIQMRYFGKMRIVERD
jgi:hypothetical protein